MKREIEASITGYTIVITVDGFRDIHIYVCIHGHIFAIMKSVTSQN